MESYDPTPLIDLCEAILADGELSADEVYSLSEFLNASPECTLHWPGKELATLLVEVWKDGEISLDELGQVAGLLVEIHTHWHDRIAENGIDVPASLLPAAEQEDTETFSLPKIDFKTTITSFTTGAYEYEVDLSDPSCTCDDWKEKRSKLPRRHFGRCCKHIISLLKNVPFRGKVRPLIDAFASTGTTPHPEREWCAGTLDGDNVFVSSPAYEWSDILVQSSGDWAHYKYNVLDSRWAYQKEPAQANLLLEILTDAFPETAQSKK